MTLFEKLSDIVPFGWNVRFRCEFNMFFISIEKYIHPNDYFREQCMPISDHFTEERINYCIDFMIEDIQKENTENNL